ncbi:MAG: AtpZ/AtpI family protein [Cyclobacteriaceae bacterium]
MLVTLAIAGVGGYFLDQWIGWQFPLFLLLFILVALGGSIYLLIKATSDE